MLKKIAFLIFVASMGTHGSLLSDAPDFQTKPITATPALKGWAPAEEQAEAEASNIDFSELDFPMEDGEFGLDQLKTLEAEIGVSNELTFGQKMALARAFVSARVHATKEHIYQNKEIYLIATALVVAAGITWYGMKNKGHGHKCGSGCKHKH